MTSEPSAAQCIRDSIAALPEDCRGQWARYRQYVNAVDGIPVCDTAFAPGNSIAAHIALMDPQVGEALANLLAQISQPPNDLWAHFVRVSAEALETIILQKEGI